MSGPETYREYALKRPLDLLVAACIFLLTLPLTTLALTAVWLADGANPLYVSERVGRYGRSFRFLKIRTMRPDASANGIDTTVSGDPRLTRVGRLIRALKLDELPQVLHVLRGEMSMVGPRPNIPREVARYTAEERRLLTARPGITDFASVVFADLASALPREADPNVAYNQLVRPWKSRLGLHYLRCASVRTDLRLICHTLTVMVARRRTLEEIATMLRRSGASEELCRFVLREEPLRPSSPPGADIVVTSRGPR